MLFGIILFAILFGVLYGVAVALVGVTVGARYNDDWVTSKAVKIFDGAFNIGLSICLLNKDGRTGIAGWIAELLDMGYSSGEQLCDVLVYIGAFGLAIGIGSICWALFELMYGRPNLPTSKPQSVPKATEKEVVGKEASPSNSDIFCLNCGARISAHCVLCPGCGQMIAKQKRPAAPEKPEAPEKEAPQKKEEPKKKAIFCTECGKELKAGETICRNCNSWNLDNI